MRNLALATVAVLAVLACVPGQPGSSGAPTLSATHSASHPAGPTLGLPTGAPGPATAAPEYPAAIVDPIVADAAARASADESAVTIISYEEVTWPDGSLGCPQPDMGYIQVQIDGYQVVVAVDGVEYDYRGSGIGEFELCEHVQPLPVPAETVLGGY